MALNSARMTNDTVYIAVPSGIVAGDPVSIGFITGVCETSRDIAGNATVRIKPAPAFNLSVLGATTDGSPGAGSAVAVGDKLYVNNTTKGVSKDSSGKFLGYALGTVGSGLTASIDVLLGSA